MTGFDDLWFLGDEAAQQAERTYHRFAERDEAFLEFRRTRSVSRPRFRTVAQRIRENGLPYGAHTVVAREDGAILLVRHDDVDMWVLPGGQLDGDEDEATAARRELREEAGIDPGLDGLGMLARVEFRCDGHFTWGVMPVFEATADETELSVEDPDGEITDADWFQDLPDDARDRDQLRRWRRERFDGPDPDDPSAGTIDTDE